MCGPLRMCEQEKGHADASMEGGDHIVPPRGRPPFGYRNVCGERRHVDTGDLFDPHLHAAGAHARKKACMRRKYWEGDGRARRLARYTKKRKPKPLQLTLYDASAYPEHRCSNPEMRGRHQ